ncbi:T9SS type A sorting domain-containing protein [Flammeovirga sp. MY04]|uniref:AgaG4 n=2 Tax=Flammeovirga yaeyamensis TaxID=367791 RepID=D0PR18_9BACT|nr:T9SS type A sorting domain-containing protein [Flammeovirga sp. MY04]ACY02061.1 AgaG4 [Flammeovirga yaeyamensis]ANQ52755.1 T9SS type A sorting domain-containing protein [Flammeovirga sp. MY04]
MKNIYLILLLSFNLGHLVNAQEWSNIPVPAYAGPGNTWELQSNLSDDFNYNFNAVNYKSNFGNGKWYNFYHNGWDGPGTTYWTYNKVKVDGDNLVITVAKSNNTSKMGIPGVFSGCVTSNNRVVYPVYVESAISVANISLASCFWLLSPDDTQEIDIIENYGNVPWFKQFTHISHHSFIRTPFTDYQPKDWNSWYNDNRVTANYGWGDWCWNNGNRRYMRMGVYWVGPKHFEYYIDGQLVRVMYHNATATKVNGTWEYQYFNSMNGQFPANNASGYTAVTTYATSTNYNFSTIQAASNNSNGISVIDPGNFQGGAGFTKAMDIIINVESQQWLALNHTPSDADLASSARNQMKVDWVRVYKPKSSSGGGSNGTTCADAPDYNGNSNSYTAGQYVINGGILYRKRSDGQWDWIANCNSSSRVSELVIEDIPEAQIALSPNPAKGFVKISGLGEGSYQAEIVTMQGQILSTQTVSRATNTLSTADLSPGVYIIKVAGEAQKLIVH